MLTNYTHKFKTSYFKKRTEKSFIKTWLKKILMLKQLAHFLAKKHNSKNNYIN